MRFLLVSLAIMVGGGLIGLLASKQPRWATSLAVAGVVIGGLLGLIPVFHVLLGAPPEFVRWEWTVPYGSLYFGLDALSALFLIPTLILSMAAAVYGAGYLEPWWGKKNVGAAWFFYNLLVASMVTVVLSRNAVLFLVAWEVMSLASFFLVTFEDEQESAREAGWVYLVATHLGTAFLFALFLILGREAGSMDFDRWSQLPVLAPRLAGLLFILAVIGFGTKAGFMPLHVWLPEAHPAAPSHVSALMSGVMIKMGIYGLFRTLSFLGPPPAWWGYLLIGIGLSSGILGVLFALAQHDIKRLLAYSSVENIGIIALGLGVGLTGINLGVPSLAILGLGGSLLHVINHAFFKGLLFLGAGSVVHATGTREIDQLGGLLKKMPWTGATFLVAAAAISGLPPLNGFVSELLLYMGAYQAATTLATAAFLPGLAIIVGLGLIGGFAAACFTKAFGFVFQGEPRSPHAEHAHEAGWTMRLPMVVLAAACAIIGLAPALMLQVLKPVLANWPQLSTQNYSAPFANLQKYLVNVSAVGVLLLALVSALVWLRRSLLKGRAMSQEGTWDCGYAQPTPRMQYTSSSYAQPLTSLFRFVLWTRRHGQNPHGYFPGSATLATDTPDLCHVNLYRPSFVRLTWGLSKLRWIQHGHVQLYVLYIALTLLVLLIWQLG